MSVFKYAINVDIVFYAINIDIAFLIIIFMQ